MHDVNIETLKKEWDDFYALPFPIQFKDKKFPNIFSEFVSYDGHVAGIVTSFLQGIKVDKKLIHIDEDLNKQLSFYKPRDNKSKKLYEQYLDRIRRLDRMIMLVLELYDKY